MRAQLVLLQRKSGQAPKSLVRVSTVIPSQCRQLVCPLARKPSTINFEASAHLLLSQRCVQSILRGCKCPLVLS